jgi:hypothetical protein
MAVNSGVVARIADRFVREGVVRDFQFLQADDVGLDLRQPRKKPFEAAANRIDVPGGDLHREGPLGLFDQSRFAGSG